MKFKLKSPFKPAGHQPQAIQKLTANLQKGINKQVLLGVTGSGKTFTIANVINNTQLPTLVISHNKTLAAQLYQEFKQLFPHNKVSYFVSYYDYYQPESYLPASDTYIQKEVDINDLIDQLRLQTTANLFSGPDNIVIASVSAIYNIGSPFNFSHRSLHFQLNASYPRRQLLEDLVSLYYQRSQIDFKRGSFRLRGEIIEIWPAYEDYILSLEFDNQVLKSITCRRPLSNKQTKLDSFHLFAAKQYIGPTDVDLDSIFARVRADCQKRVKFFKSQRRLLEAQRLTQKVNHDLEMIKEVGYVNGIENYSIYFEPDRRSGDPPYTLVDYFVNLWGKNFLTVIDESHVTVPQIRGMYHGDLARKQTLIDYGFRLPTALDNRPLKFTEFYQRVSKVIYVSATPDSWEINDSRTKVSASQQTSAPYIIQQIIRPTGLLDPSIKVYPSQNQIPHLISQIKKQIAQKNRTLVITLTKRMAEDLAAFLADPQKTKANFKVAYLHSDIDTLERTAILENLRSGKYDVLVGINLLREGLDLPEVSLVAILDADQQGFLRSRSSLIQIMGRASRHLSGRVILYADKPSFAMKQAIAEVNRRRRIQLAYNRRHHITPQSIKKSIRPQIIQTAEPVYQNLLKLDPLSLTPQQRQKQIKILKSQMRQAAADLDFELAIKFRDKIKQLEK